MRVQRSFGRSVYRRALAEGTARVVTPAGVGGGDVRARRSGGRQAPQPVDAERRLDAYRRQTGRREDPGYHDAPLMVEAMAPRGRAETLGLTARQRRRHDHKAGRRAKARRV